MKTRLLFVLLVMFLSALAVPVHSVPTGQGQQLFFDNFSGSQLSPYWNAAHDLYPPCAVDCETGNLSQSGGWMSLTNPRGVLWNGNNCAFANCASFIDVIANNTTPIFSTTTKSQFVYMVWRLVPFNLTQLGNNPGAVSSTRNAETVFGLFGGMGNSGTGQAFGIGWQLYESDSATNGIGRLTNANQREQIGVFILQPQGWGAANNCFADGPGRLYMPYNDWYFGYGGAKPCTGTNSTAIPYGSTANQIDLNTVHVFTMEASLQVSGGSSWAAFSVDNNGWLNVTNSACQCLNQVTVGQNGFGNLYPYINAGYCMGTGGLPDPQYFSCAHQVPSQSAATFINYVLIDNYVPANLPVGLRPPTSNIVTTPNPIATPTNGLNGVSISNWWQDAAQIIGSGVPGDTGQFLVSGFYFGGTVLFMITVLLILLATLFAPGPDLFKSPFVISILLFFDTIGNFLLGTLPIWIFAGGVVFFMAVMVGTVPVEIGFPGRKG